VSHRNGKTTPTPAATSTTPAAGIGHIKGDEDYDQRQ
jgi:hypothetical protein